MLSSRPYFIRALYDWIVDSGLTPHIIVDAEADGVDVPAGYSEDGSIVLNISPGAVVGLDISNQMISFSARFGGVARSVSVPIMAVHGIYARENGRGMIFEDFPDEPEPPSPSASENKRPSLKIVK